MIPTDAMTPSSPYRAICAWGAALLAALSVVGCGPDEPQGPPPTYKFDVEVDTRLQNSSEDFEPLPGVPVHVDGKRVGFTDASGKFRAVMIERPGREVTISLGDVEGVRFDGTTEITEKLEVKKSLAGDKKRGVPILLDANAVSTRQTYYIWVDANCDQEYLDADACRDLPVKRDGEVVTTTDRTGHAFLPITSSSKKTVEIVIDTPTEQETIEAAKQAGESNPDGYVMKPQDPTYQLELGFEPKAFVLKETFEDPKAEEEAKRRRRRQRRRRQQQQQQQQQEEEDEGSGIDLF